MRILSLLMLVCCLFAEDKWITYVHDKELFVAEDLVQGDQRTAIVVAKSLLSLRFKAEVTAIFSIAAANWGYQVNFHTVKVQKEGAWRAVPEGFGEVYVSKDGSRVKLDFGP